MLWFKTMIGYFEELEMTAREVINFIRENGSIPEEIVKGHIRSIALAHDLTNRIVDQELGKAMVTIFKQEEPEGWE